MYSQKVEKVLKELTLEEKCLILTGGGALNTAEIERLCVPKIEMSDGPHGVRRLIGHPTDPQECAIEGGDTCFPTASAMGSSFNIRLCEKMGRAIAKDCQQEGIDMLLAPATNMKRTPICGRNFEYFSEDPVLAGEMAGAFIRGVQSGNVGTSLKHFACNNQETNRTTISVEVDERTLREYYLEPFRIAIEKGNPDSVMCAYNKLGGIWCSENKWLLTDVLKNEWGYDGLVVSDWNAVHNSAKAQAAGLNLEMPQNKNIVNDIKEGLKKGFVTIEAIDDSCRRILNYVYKKSENRIKEPYDRAEQHRLAYEAATECITLLRNTDNILPLKPENFGKEGKLVVFGRGAQDPVFMGGGSSAVTVDPKNVERPIDWIRKYCEGKCEVIYEKYGPEMTDRERLMRTRTVRDYSDTAVVFVSSELFHETEGDDRRNINIPEYICEFLETIRWDFEKVVVVLESGALTVSGADWPSGVKGIIQMWLCGEGGGKAIADVLFGKVNPSGKLSESFSRYLRGDMAHRSWANSIRYTEGLDVGYRYYDKHPEEIWFPFGHGLSYTTFSYSDLKISPESSNDPDQKVTVTFKVKNTGDMAGKEAVQLYVAPVDSTVYRPDKELKAFDKIYLEPGEEKEVTLTLDKHAFAYFNPYLHDWHVESGEYKILIASSSVDIRLSGIYTVDYEKDYTQSPKRKAIIL